MAATLDYRQIEKKDATDGKFPARMKVDYRVHLNERAYEAMKKHAATTSEVELCGVLVGDVKRDDNGNFLTVVGTIEGKNANNYGAQVTFTHQTWEYINQVKDREYPNQRIVGWYHTHPGFGIFLSKMDMFIQENFFNQPYQVAIVIETRKNEEGCFVWEDGECKPLQRYWAGQNEVKLAVGEADEFELPAQPGPVVPAATQPQPPEARWGIGMYGLLFALAAFLSGLLFGRMTVMADLRRNLAEGLESEIYSILEFAGMSTLAARDFADIRDRIGDAGAKLKGKDPAGAEAVLKDVATQISSLEAQYEKRRHALRGDLNRVMTEKQGLSERLSALMQRQDRLDAYMGLLWLARLAEFLQRDGKPIDLEKLSPTERERMLSMVEIAIRLTPDAKESLGKLHPGLLDYPFPERKNNKEGDKRKEKDGV